MEWNFYCRFMYELQLETCISLALNMMVFYTPENNVEVWAKWTTVAFFVLEGIFLLTFCYLFFIPCNTVARMEKHEVKFGCLYEHVKYQESWINRTVPFLFLAKRTFFVAICVYLKVECLMIMIEVKFANLLLIVYAKPYVD